MRELKDIITESFNKEYGYRIKLARDCTAEDLTKLENALQKYVLHEIAIACSRFVNDL